MIRQAILSACFVLLCFCSHANAAVQVSLLDDTVLDADALLFATSAPYGRAINGVSFQTEPHLTYGGYQFVVWYHRGASDEDVYMARRNLTGGVWEIMDTGVDMTRTTSDAHNVVAMGVSGDGAIHVSWDMHGHTLKYMNSAPGAATGATWNASIFSGERSSLNPGGTSITVVTYPRFILYPNTGDLVMTYRVGSSGSGDMMFATYDAGTALWDTPHEIIDGRDGDVYTDPLGSSSSRNAYLNGLDIDGTGRIHTTWTWRESAGGTNHDICYIYSDNGGASWRNNDGTNLGNLVKLPSTGIKIDDGNSGNGILGELNRLNTVMNQQTQAVDQDNRVHTVMWHADDAHRDAVSGFNTTVSAYFHYYRDPVTGDWQRTELPTSREVGSRPDIAYDASGNLYVIYVTPGPGDPGGYYTNGDLVIASATKATDYTDWAIVYTDTRDFAGEPFIDQQRLLNDDILSVFIQENSAVTSLTGSPLHILDFSIGTILTWTGDDLGVWTTGVGMDWDTDGDDVGDVAFSAADTVWFDDGAAVFTVPISGLVAPDSVRFNNTVNAYTLSGSGIGGAGSLTVSGGGAVTLANGANTYSGDTLIVDGSLSLFGSAAIGGSANIDVAADGTFDISAATSGSYALDGQRLSVGGSVVGDIDATNDSIVHVGTANSIDGNVTVGSGSLLDGAGRIIGNLVAQDGTVRVGGEGLTFGYSSFVFDDFASYSTGAIRDVASPPWVAHSDTIYADIQDDGSGNNVLTFGTNYFIGVSRDMPADAWIDDDEVATFFFRVYSSTDVPDFSFGLSDGVDTGGTVFSDFEAQVRIVDDPGASGTFLLDARDGGGFSATLASGLTTGTWYNVWMVIDQTTDTYDVYLNTGTSDAVSGNKLNGAPLHFRNGTTAPLNKVLGIGVASINYAARYDDLTYLSGADLSNPLGGLTPSLVGGGETLTVDGNARMGPDATLELDVVSGAIADRLDVGGQFTAGGTINVVLSSGAPTPQPGDAFDLVDAASFVGAFDTVAVPAVGAGNVWDLRELYTSGVISVLSADAALDECIACLTGPGGTLAPGCESQDQDGDNDVDLYDYMTVLGCVSDASGVLMSGCLAN